MHTYTKPISDTWARDRNCVRRCWNGLVRRPWAVFARQCPSGGAAVRSRSLREQRRPSVRPQGSFLADGRQTVQGSPCLAGLRRRFGAVQAKMKRLDTGTATSRGACIFCGAAVSRVPGVAQVRLGSESLGRGAERGPTSPCNEPSQPPWENDSKWAGCKSCAGVAEDLLAKLAAASAIWRGCLLLRPFQRTGRLLGSAARIVLAASGSVQPPQ